MQRLYAPILSQHPILSTVFPPIYRRDCFSSVNNKVSIMPAQDNATISRAPRSREHPYVMISRETLQDSGITYEASGMLAELLSRPDNWKVKVSQLRHRGDGRDRIYRILNELIQAKYIYRTDQRNSKGHMLTHYTVFETRGEGENTIVPVRKIRIGTDNPDTDNPYPENTDTTYKRGLQKREVTDMDAAEAASSAPTAKKKTKTVLKPRSECLFDPMYVTVEREVFSIASTEDDPYLWNGQIGQIARWLKGEIARVARQEVGKLATPAQPGQVSEFIRWYKKQNKDASVPLDPVKFVNHWRAFLSATAHKRDKVWSAPTPMPAPVQTETDRAALRELLAAHRAQPKEVNHDDE